VSEGSQYKKRIYISAIAIGLAIGSIGVAAAATGNDRTAPPSTKPAAEVEDPPLTGSIQVPAGDESTGEKGEAAQLAGLATVTPERARDAALAAVPGIAGKVELDNENGAVVYSVEITDSAGAEIDVKVDAGNGRILDRQSADRGEAGQADDSSGEIDSGDADAVEEQTGEQHQHEADDETGEGIEDLADD